MVTLPLVRTRDEAHLYLDLHPCERCGSVDVAWDSTLIQDGGMLARRYHGSCEGCDARREFVFAVPETPAVAGADDVVFFGGPEPSRLLDPGEWMLVADLCGQAATVPAGSAAGSAEHREALESLATAAAAIDEILKFVPAGSNTVPESAFWSARGRTILHREPGRFHRRRLLVVRDSYREALARMSAT